MTRAPHWTDGPILFLDIDGVLNSLAYANAKKARGENGPLGIDPDAVKHLQRVVDETDCSIVLSSTWRIGTMLSEIRGKLIAAGMRSPVPLRDKTADLSRPANSQTGVWVAVKRGDEVKHWLETSDYTGRYVCIDDDSDFLEGQPLVRTTFREGMTSAHADECIRILKGLS